MDRIYKKYVSEKFDNNGRLTDISFKYPDNYNFAYDVADELARTKPDKVAMIWISNDGEERRFTFRDIKFYSDKTANYLASLGVKKGDKVMLILKRHYQFWFAMMALHKLGAVAVPATHQLMKKDLVYRFNKARVRAVLCTPDDEVSHEIDLIDETECKNLKYRVMVNGARDGWEDFDKGVEAASENLERVDTLAIEPMLMYFSSGTTGYPKCVQHSHLYTLGHIVTAVHWHMVKDDGVHFTISDTGWGKAVWGKLYGAWFGETTVFTYDFNRFSSEKILPMFAKYNITTFCAPPTMYRFFIKEDLSKYDLSSLVHTTIAGEALNPEVFKQFYNATGLKLMEGFGQTETTLTIANIGNEPKPGSMGLPNPQYKVVLIGGDGNPAKTGDVGEICIDTEGGTPPGMFMGYYDDEEATKQAWHDGLYHTGDMAWRDEDGYFWYVGRTDDLIKSSGYRIGPFEIESVLMEHPSVLECAITGVPDPVRGQVVKATIVLAKGYTAGEELKKELQEYVKHHTAPYKYPRVVEFVEELPKTISGKIKRKEIRESSN